MIELLGKLGLVFVVGFLLPIIPIFPIRLAFLIPIVAISVHPILVALAAAVGASLGTVPLYAVSLKAREAQSIGKWLERPWFKKLTGFLQGKMFATVFLFALFPLPDQLMSVVGGLERYPVSRMILAFFLGRLPYFLLLGYIGSVNRELIQGAWRSLIGALGI